MPHLGPNGVPLGGGVFDGKGAGGGWMGGSW